MTQNLLKIDRTMARILKMFDWYSTLRLVKVISDFEHWVEADNLGKRWRWALLDFYHNVCFHLKQLIEVLHCDLQVTIHQELVEVQADILKAIANFLDNFCLLLRCVLCLTIFVLDMLVAIPSWLPSGEVLHLQDQSFLQNGPMQLLKSFFDRLPDY